MQKILISTFVVLFASVFLLSPRADAKQICGWYAIASCTRSQSDAANFASNGWGSVINTNQFSGLKRGYFCVVSGPQSKSSATRDKNAALADGVSTDIYIKRACADERSIGD